MEGAFSGQSWEHSYLLFVNICFSFLLVLVSEITRGFTYFYYWGALHPLKLCLFCTVSWRRFYVNCARNQKSQIWRTHPFVISVSLTTAVSRYTTRQNTCCNEFLATWDGGNMWSLRVNPVDSKRGRHLFENLFRFQDFTWPLSMFSHCPTKWWFATCFVKDLAQFTFNFCRLLSVGGRIFCMCNCHTPHN